MNKEALTNMVTRAYNLGVFDDLISIELEHQIDSCFYDLIKIRERAVREGVLLEQHAEDFSNCVHFVKSALVVLRWYTTDDYEEEQKKIEEEEDWIKHTSFGDTPYA